MMKRRHFLKSSSAAALAAFPNIVPGSALGNAGRPAPSERITVGVIGLGAMGTGNMNGFLGKADAQIVAVCDVDRAHNRDQPRGAKGRFGREPAKAAVESRYASEMRDGKFNGCDTYSDFRELCARDDIDAVVVATPDHWHALCTLDALRGGKDVYCEKPVTHLFAEGQAVYREVEKRKAIFQTGSQQRSEIRFRVAAEVVLNGLIGKVKSVEVGLPTGPSLPKAKPDTPSDPPEGLDYDLWCGPGEMHPYIFARHHRNWRWHLSYGGGNLMDWIGHHNDIAHWGLGMDNSGPEEIESVGWTFPETDIYNGAVNYEIRCTYPGGITSSISNKNTMGTKWVGEDGWIYVNRGKIEASNREWIREKFDRGPVKAYVSLDHRKNFLDCIKSRKPCISPAETTHRSITPGHLGFISQKLGRALRWDAKTESVTGDEEADRLLKEVGYRKPWTLS